MAKQQPPRVTHFGQFVRWHRVHAGLTADAYAKQLGLTGRRLFAIEAMAEPAVNHTTLAALAKSMKLDTVEDLDHAWRSTPVPVTARRSGPTTETASRFAAACRLVGVDPVEGLRRLRRWITDQPEAVQRDALSAKPAADPATFTTAVGHRQDPAEAQADRVGRRAGRPRPNPGRSPAPAATAGSTHR